MGAILGILGAFSGVGLVVLLIVAVLQQTKQGGSFKQAFYTFMSFIMLATLVGSSLAILSATAKQFVFTDASSKVARLSPPPALYLPNAPADKNSGVPQTYTCPDSCQFSAEDKAQITTWETAYQDWRSTGLDSGAQFRSDLVTPLAFLIVSLPLYLLFLRVMERGAKQELDQLKKPTSLRSLYMYLVAISGLLLAIFSSGWLLNTGLRSWLKADTSTTNVQTAKLPTPETTAVASLISCADQCGFTANQVQLATQWESDYQTWQSDQMAPGSQAQDDFANQLPALLIGFPLFWFHFARIRKESSDHENQTPSPATS